MRTYRASWGYDMVGYTLEDNAHRHMLNKTGKYLFKFKGKESIDGVDENWLKVMQLTDYAVKHGFQRFKRIE